MPEPTSWSAALPYLLAALVFGYLAGSIMFGPIVTRLFGLGDLRTIGSGNVGATNVLRTGRKLPAGLTFLGDALKGTAAVVIAAQWGADTALCAALGAFLGHLFPVWLKFRGGKGTATYIGLLLGLYWPAAFFFAALWLLTAFTTRYSSLSALVASFLSPILFAVVGQWQNAGLFACLTVLLFFRHAANIRRLVRGEESRIGRARS
ncbi:glycerol-3-phosphate 1-O-acyltransferase PlsY [Microbaculum marinum]|uniref:Glycerol-3-phosphate acyltransferase n=1 Tax=Microbaculum marinum TaxID=1764581 RepID=A0AAW9RWZ3_9HYPH